MLGLISRNAQFRLFWIGQTASMLGNYALPVALALFAALHFKSVGAVGLVLAARALGSVIMLLIGGALADMWDRRKLMIVSDVARLLLVAVLATSPGSLSLTVLVCLLLGCGEGLFYPAYNAFTVELVPPEDRQSANSLNSTGVQTAAVAAPACACRSPRRREAREGYAHLKVAVPSSPTVHVVQGRVDPSPRVDSRDPGCPGNGPIHGRRVADEHAAVQRPQPRAGLDAELLGQNLAARAVRLQRLGVSAGAA
jgi:MFS transporter